MTYSFKKKVKIDFFYLLNLLICKFNEENNHKINNIRNKRIAIYANDSIGSQINQFGFYEKEELDILLSFIKEKNIKTMSKIAIDVGANIGNHTLYFRDYFKKILAFEPNINSFNLLKINCGKFKNIECFNYGLGEKNKKIILFENPNNIGGSSIYFGKNDDLPKVKSKILKLDNLNIKNIGLIKIDVEGYEYQVILGGYKSILANRPVIVFEHLNKTKYKEEIKKIFKKLNYKIYVFNRKKIANSKYMHYVNYFYDIVFGRTYELKETDLSSNIDFPMLIALPSQNYND